MKEESPKSGVWAVLNEKFIAFCAYTREKEGL